jgi:hypothetical protein
MPTNDVTPDFSRLFAEYKELQRTHFPDVDEMPEAVIDRLQEIEDTIATTPAATLADAAVKVELLAFRQREGVAPPKESPASRLAAGLVADLSFLSMLEPRGKRQGDDTICSRNSERVRSRAVPDAAPAARHDAIVGHCRSAASGCPAAAARHRPPSRRCARRDRHR